MRCAYFIRAVALPDPHAACVSSVPLRQLESKQVAMGAADGADGASPFPWLQAVVLFNSAVYVLHTYLDFRQQKVGRSLESLVDGWGDPVPALRRA